MLGLKPLPCPNPKCLSTDVYVRGRCNAQVTCRNCGMEGPEFCGPNEIVAAWNTLPRALRWTAEPPKVAGWYWYSMGYGHTVCLLVCADGKAKLGKDHFTDSELLGGKWAGPIPAPVEE